MQYNELNEHYQAVAEKFLPAVGEATGAVLKAEIKVQSGDPAALSEEFSAKLEFPVVKVTFSSTAEVSYTHLFVMDSTLAGLFFSWSGAGEPPEEIGDEHLDAVRKVVAQIIGQLKSTFAEEITFETDEVQVALATSVEELELPSEALAADYTFTRGDEEREYRVSYILSSEAAAAAEEEAAEKGAEAPTEETGEEAGAEEAAEEEPTEAGEETVADTEGPPEEQLAAEGTPAEASTKESGSLEGGPDLSGLFDSDVSGGDEGGIVEISPAEFGEFDHVEGANGRGRKIDMLLDVELGVTVELGRRLMSIDEILRLGKGSVVELDKLAGEPVDILVNGKKLAEGEVVVVEDHFGVRLTHLLNPQERIKSLGG